MNWNNRLTGWHDDTKECPCPHCNATGTLTYPPTSKFEKVATVVMFGIVLLICAFLLLAAYMVRNH